MPTLAEYIDSRVREPNIDQNDICDISEFYPFLMSPHCVIGLLMREGEFSNAALLFWKLFQYPCALYTLDVALEKLFSTFSHRPYSLPLLHPLPDTKLMHSSDWKLLTSFCDDIALISED